MDFDSIVIGAGAVGLAVARALALTGRSVLVLERWKHPGQETSSRNSEVIHAGIYYPKGSLKAQLCVRGRDLLYDYCTTHKVSHQRVGKLIVATEPGQDVALEAIYNKGLVNGVTDLEFLDQQQIHAMEPRLRAVRAIWSPSTGIINSHELMVAYRGDLEAAGGTLALTTGMTGGRRIEGGFELIAGQDEFAVTCREVINCAGLSAQAVSRSLEGIPSASVPPQYLSRGCYFSMAGKAPFSHLIYPLPNNEGLGVHLTLDLAGSARFGPDTQWVDAIDYQVDPNRVDAFYSSIRAFYPDLADGALKPDYAGIRPKISGPDETAADFLIQGDAGHGVKGFVALYGIESPGLTASLSIAEYVVALLDQ